MDVTTVDLQMDLVQNADHVARELGWDLKNHVMDLSELDLDRDFDQITSICVFEHLPVSDRVAVNSRIRDLLVENGRFSITFDYRNPSRFARIGTPADIKTQFIEPSGLRIRGNRDFFDNGKNFLLYPHFHQWRAGRYWLRISRGLKWPLSFRIGSGGSNDYTFGALFLEK
jgi:hypothetical protein